MKVKFVSATSNTTIDLEQHPCKGDFVEIDRNIAVVTEIKYVLDTKAIQTSANDPLLWVVIHIKFI